MRSFDLDALSGFWGPRFVIIEFICFNAHAHDFVLVDVHTVRGRRVEELVCGGQGRTGEPEVCTLVGVAGVGLLAYDAVGGMVAEETYNVEGWGR